MLYSPYALLSLEATLLPLKPSMRMDSLLSVMVVRSSAHIGSTQLSAVKGSGEILAFLVPAAGHRAPAMEVIALLHASR